MKHSISALVIAMVIAMTPLSLQSQGSATIEFERAEYGIAVGEQLDVVVDVNPNGEKLDTVRAVVTFDPLVLQAQTITLIGKFDRVAPGNYYDNTVGKISWGAFRLEGPVSEEGVLLKITFLAKAEGEASMVITPDSRAISNGEEKINPSSVSSAQVKVSGMKEVEQGLAQVIVESETHPDESVWYANNEVKFSWVRLQGESEITAYYYSFNESASSDPVTYLPASKTSLDLKEVEDGVHYLHIRGVQNDGRQTAVVHKKVQVDVTAPNPIELLAQDEKIIEGESAWFTFATLDEMSGVVQYQVAINNSEYKVQESPLEITDLKAGTYFIRVAALDRAGNASHGSATVRVYPQGIDLERPEGYEESAELQAIAEKANQEDWWMGFWVKTIGSVLVAFVVVVIGNKIHKKIKK
jgi:hypothetical protein